MKVLVYQSPVRANLVLDAISDCVGEETAAFRVAVAYVTREGARTLVEVLKARTGQGWQELTKKVITCFDFGHTEPTALEYLQQQGFEVRIANQVVDGMVQVRSGTSSFHPKLYLASGLEQVRAVVGSANLTRRALSVNAEAVSAMELDPQSVEEVWTELEARSALLSTQMLDKYKEIRPRQRRPLRQDEPAVPDPVAPADLPIFKDVVEAELFDFVKHDAFWVEVGGPSGGSGSQLELPRLAHRFFGYEFNTYDDEHHVIGEPTLTTTTGSWPRPLTWHGNNRMERINLPTPSQSNLTYSHRVVLFQRSGVAFEITVSEPNSPRAIRWREESAASGTLFRVSDRSARRCGLI